MCIYTLSEIPLLGIYPKDTLAKIQKRYTHKAIHCRTIYNTEKLEPTQIFISKGLVKCPSTKWVIMQL